MKKILTTLALSAFVMLMVNCSPKVGNVVTGGPVPTKAEIKIAYSPDELEQGQMIWQRSCDKCHKLYGADSRTPEKWNSILRKMIPKAKLNLHDAKLVHAYLIANAQGN